MSDILLVEDSTFMGRVMAAQLAHAGFSTTVWEPPSPGRVESLLAGEDARLLITDLRMPGCGGSTLARMVRRLRPDMRILLVTAVREPEVDQLLAKRWVDRVLYKPVAGAELAEAATALLGGPGAS